MNAGRLTGGITHRHLTGEPHHEVQCCARCGFVLADVGMTPLLSQTEIVVQSVGKSRHFAIASLGDIETLPACTALPYRFIEICH